MLAGGRRRAEKKGKRIGAGRWQSCPLVLEQEIPVVGGLGGLAGAAEQPLEGLLLRVLGRAGLDVPHAERDVPGGGDDDLVLVEHGLVMGLVEVDVPHDAVDEARREGRGLGAVNVALVVAGQPDRDI